MIDSLSLNAVMVSELLSLLGLCDKKIATLEKVRQLLLGSDMAESDGTLALFAYVFSNLRLTLSPP